MQTAILFCVVQGLLAAEPAKTVPAVAKPIDLAQVTAVELDPPAVLLDDPRTKQRVLVTGKIGDRLVDLTDQATFTSSNPAVFTVNDRHEAVPTVNGADGAGELSVAVGSHAVKAAVTVKNQAAGRAVNFTNEIVPIFTKLTCNSGGCHGKSGGQNGFRLSLLGFEPTQDYEYLVKESRGRRMFPAAPEQSALLRKATGRTPHGGGRLMKENDDNHQLVVAWVKQGMPFGKPTDPTVARIEVFPKMRVMDRFASQRLRVSAHMSDGRVEDVTRFAQFQSNDESVATVDGTGKVLTSDLSGEAAVMARYMGQVIVFRAAVPAANQLASAPAFTPKNYVDQWAMKKWQALGLQPSGASTDPQFLRRLYLDLCGRLPTPEEAGRFLASTDAAKRDQLVDELLAGNDYPAFMALKWGAILQNKRAGNQAFAGGTHAMSLWLKEAFANDMPYDQFARAVLTASGTPDMNPPVVWYRSVRTAEENVDNVSQLFLGTRVQCARCHHHPFEKWSQDDYYSMASFFTRVSRKNFDADANSGGPQIEAVFTLRSGMARHPKTGAEMKPRGLDAPALDVAAGVDPRAKLADWMADPKNPFFARALANRVWGHFFTRGIVEPIDDMRVTNPPSNPELLDALADDFVKNGFRIKHLV
ncbi:MAG: DUF1549 domain-containing protein, partial [Planctomycetia bacterium]